jgi:hypothetical protein
MEDLYKHIFLSGNKTSEKYKTAPSHGATPNIPDRNRASHSRTLLDRFDEIWQEKETLNQQRDAAQIPTRDGTYLAFKSELNHDLITKSLEDLRKNIRLLNIQETQIENNNQTIATVYIPKGKENHFIDKILKYQSEVTLSGEPKNAPLVNSIEDVSTALLKSMWTDKVELIPVEYSKWCEVWLNVSAEKEIEQEQIQNFKNTLEIIEIDFKNHVLHFPERAILLINANRNQLIELMHQSDILAEFRTGQELAGFWIDESPTEQQEWIDDLLQRVEVISSDVKVCVLDSGTNNGHQLLSPILQNEDALTVDENWGTYDHEHGSGHGTLMSGIAGYGTLEELLSTNFNVPLTHKLCSVKILPPPTATPTPKELWGEIVIQGVARAEIQNPNVNFIYCMAVTSIDGVDRGKPSSWSGAIDTLAFGDDENKKLIVISAGNIRAEEDWKNYPNSNYTASIENPAQAWNSITIGAYTKKTRTKDNDYSEYNPVANEGELSPFSTTSLVWAKKWPMKPDVVFEGGNLLQSPDNNVTRHEDLELLSTSKQFNTKPFDTIYATSAATALASWFAAKIAFTYPNAWAETIRGLIVHSSDWNQAMINQLDIDINRKSDFFRLLRVFGYGEPNLERALHSSESSFTFIAQEEIQPFSFNSNNRPETNEIHIFNLPWPQDLLLSMSNIPVKLKITLSYFIEPGAGEIGWKDKYRYQSHGLRFDINNTNEDEETFRKRVNIAARDEDEKFSSNSGSQRWKLGAKNRSNGSIHSDFWEGTAAELATCHYIAIFPIIGWWRERKHLGKVENKTRYSLIISLETPSQDVELYTTVKNIIEIPIEIQV